MEYMLQQLPCFGRTLCTIAALTYTLIYVKAVYNTSRVDLHQNITLKVHDFQIDKLAQQGFQLI